MNYIFLRQQVERSRSKAATSDIARKIHDQLASQFRSELDVLRPHGNVGLDAACKQPKLPDGSPDPVSRPQPDDLEVRWVERGHTDRLTSGAYGPLRGELQSALGTLGVDAILGETAASRLASAVGRKWTVANVRNRTPDCPRTDCKRGDNSRSTGGVIGA
jgi:hypothetical protein